MSFGNPGIVRASGTSLQSTPLPPSPTSGTFAVAYYSGANVGVGAGATVKVPLNTLVSDPGGGFDLTNNWYRCPVTGIYQCSFEGEFVCGGAASGIAQAVVQVNGATRINGTTATQGNGLFLVSTGGGILSCNAGDQITLAVSAPGGAAGNINGATGNPAVNTLSVQRIG